MSCNLINCPVLLFCIQLFLTELNSGVFVVTAICFIILFLWMIVLQGEFNSLRKKLQELINEEPVSSSQNPNGGLGDLDESVCSVFEPEPQTTTPQPVLNTEVQDEQNPAQQEAAEVFEQQDVSDNAKKPEKDKNGFEKIFLGNIFNKVGALAIIIGVIFFIKVVSQYIVFTPLMKCLIAFMAGAGMVGYALKLHYSNMKNYAEVLMGTGFAVLFITVYCASSLYDILHMPAATVFGILLVLLTYFIADRFKTFSTFIIGFIGGYLNPFFVNTNITMGFLFGYLIFLNLVSAVYVSKNESKKMLNVINLILTAFTVSVFSAVKDYDINYLFPIGLWALYAVNDIIDIVKNRYNDSYKGSLGFNLFNFAVLLYFIKFFASGKFLETGLFALFAAALYSVSPYICKIKDNENIKYFVHGILLSFLISTYFSLTGTQRVCVWAVEALVLAYIARERKYLVNWSVAFLLTSFTGIFFVKNAMIYGDLSSYTPVFNFRLLLYGIPALCAFTASIWHRENTNISNLLKFLALSFVYLFGVFEINAAYGKYLKTDEESLWDLKIYTYSIIGFIYALNTKRLADSLQSMLFKVASYVIYIYSLAALLLVCAAAESGNNGMLPVLNLRFLTFAFAVATSLYYLRKTSKSLFAYMALICGFFCLHFEIAALTENNALAVSLVWILYSGVSTLIGIFKEKSVLKNFGIWVLILAILKVMLFDIADMAIHYKFIAFIVLGVILMIVSYFYSKIKSKED